MIFNAIKFVAQAHQGHFRKGTKIPYITHLMNVMKILIQYNCDETTVVAGILHDVVEDTSVTIEEVEDLFGKEVSAIVVFATEKSKLNKEKQDERLTWKKRKMEYIEELEKCDDLPCLMVCAADKLDNISAIDEDFQAIGDKLWQRFNATKDEQKWYYEKISDILNKKSEKFEKLTKISDRIISKVKNVYG